MGSKEEKWIRAVRQEDEKKLWEEKRGMCEENKKKYKGKTKKQNKRRIRKHSKQN